jgi:molybdate transport system substrate-binding protein
MNARSFIAGMMAAMAITMGHAVTAQGAEVKVFATNSLTDVLQQIIPQFERSGGHKVTVVYDTALLLLERIKRGETADLIIINPAAIDDLAKQGRAVAATKTPLASINMGVAVRNGLPKPDISTVAAFKDALLAAKSVTYTATGTSGIHFVKVIEQLGIAQQVKAKAKTPPGGRVGDLLVAGEADLAVQQIPELVGVKGIDFVGPLPKEVQLTSVTAIAMLAGSKQPEAASAFLKLLAASAAVFKEKGMDPALP